VFFFESIFTTNGSYSHLGEGRQTSRQLMMLQTTIKLAQPGWVGIRNVQLIFSSWHHCYCVWRSVPS